MLQVGLATVNRDISYLSNEPDYNEYKEKGLDQLE